MASSSRNHTCGEGGPTESTVHGDSSGSIPPGALDELEDGIVPGDGHPGILDNLEDGRVPHRRAWTLLQHAFSVWTAAVDWPPGLVSSSESELSSALAFPRSSDSGGESSTSSNDGPDWEFLLAERRAQLTNAALSVASQRAPSVASQRAPTPAPRCASHSWRLRNLPAMRPFTMRPLTMRTKATLIGVCSGIIYN